MSKKSETSNSEESNPDYYCGVQEPPPQGKTRASLEYCIQHNQLRYYGIVAIDPKLLVTMKIRTSDLNKELSKLHEINNNIKILIKNFKSNQRILSDENTTNAKRKRAEIKRESLLKKRDKLKKQFALQTKIVKNAEIEDKKQKAEAEKLKKKEDAKNEKKTRSRSGSKSLKTKRKSSKK